MLANLRSNGTFIYFNTDSYSYGDFTVKFCGFFCCFFKNITNNKVFLHLQIKERKTKNRPN